MKKFLQLLCMICLWFNLSCAQNPNLVKKVPFTITQSYFTSWVAQNSENSTGKNVFITIEDLPKNIELKEIYFKGQQALLTKAGKEGNYQAQFYSEKKDYVLDSDTRKEQKNPKPHIIENSPVKITKDQALLVYKRSGKTQYYIIDKLQNKGTKHPAEAPFNKND